jgi:hypothetical protein
MTVKVKLPFRRDSSISDNIICTCITVLLLLLCSLLSMFICLSVTDFLSVALHLPSFTECTSFKVFINGSPAKLLVKQIIILSKQLQIMFQNLKTDFVSISINDNIITRQTGKWKAMGSQETWYIVDLFMNGASDCVKLLRCKFLQSAWTCGCMLSRSQNYPEISRHIQLF